MFGIRLTLLTTILAASNSHAVSCEYFLSEQAPNFSENTKHLQLKKELPSGQRLVVHLINDLAGPYGDDSSAWKDSNLLSQGQMSFAGREVRIRETLMATISTLQYTGAPLAWGAGLYWASRPDYWPQSLELARMGMATGAYVMGLIGVLSTANYWLMSAAEIFPEAWRRIKEAATASNFDELLNEVNQLLAADPSIKELHLVLDPRLNIVNDYNRTQRTTLIQQHLLNSGFRTASSEGREQD